MHLVVQKITLIYFGQLIFFIFYTQNNWKDSFKNIHKKADHFSQNSVLKNSFCFIVPNFVLKKEQNSANLLLHQFLHHWHQSQYLYLANQLHLKTKLKWQIILGKHAFTLKIFPARNSYCKPTLIHVKESFRTARASPLQMLLAANSTCGMVLITTRVWIYFGCKN